MHSTAVNNPHRIKTFCKCSVISKNLKIAVIRPYSKNLIDTICEEKNIWNIAAFTLAISEIHLLTPSINGQKKHLKELYIGVKWQNFKYIEIKKIIIHFIFNSFP